MGTVVRSRIWWSRFAAEGPNRLWVADITYIPTGSGFLCLAVVLDAWSRRVVGWSVATHLRTELVLEPLNMAVWQRRPSEVIHHADQGTQYTSVAFGLRCLKAQVRPSMGSVGDCFDNPMCESFFATLECELLNRQKFKTPTEARHAVFEFVESWYNPRRRHSAITPAGDLPEYEGCRPHPAPRHPPTPLGKRCAFSTVHRLRRRRGASPAEEEEETKASNCPPKRGQVQKLGGELTRPDMG
jgi:transposase InsO family protein